MFELNFLSLFKRKVKKLTRRDPKLATQFKTTLDLLAADPTDVRLRSHKVTHRGRAAFSSSVTGDLRIIWDYSNDEVNMLDIIDTGGHEGGKGVYR